MGWQAITIILKAFILSSSGIEKGKGHRIFCCIFIEYFEYEKKLLMLKVSRGVSPEKPMLTSANLHCARGWVPSVLLHT